MFSSWKTTFAGLIAVLTGLGMLGGIFKSFIGGEPTTLAEWSLAVATISGGLGLIAARDNKVTSEESGAK